jgi:di/tricarboxylate transporter
MLALTGGLGACNRTLYPSRCSRITTIAGAVIGVTAGAFIGWNDRSGLDDRLENAAWGTLVGAAGGVVLKLGLQHYGWPDVAAASAVGLAVGASIEGAGIGLAVGTVTGLLLWQLSPSVGPGGAVAWGLAGMAVGGLADWVAGALQGGSDINGIPMQFSIPW